MAGAWEPYARALADEISHPGSRWYPVLSGLPRHRLVPAWWIHGDDGWALHDGPVQDAYANRSLVTRIGPVHADEADAGARPTGRPTSSSTEPGLLLTMYGHAQLAAGLDVLDVGTGSGYGTALLARRYGAARVTSVDVDPYLVAAATERLAGIGLHPRLTLIDATSPGLLPGTYDRIVATVAVPSIPRSWLAALRPGGRIVAVIAGTWMILVVSRTPDGFMGHVARDWAGFMPARAGTDYPPGLAAQIWEADGEQIGFGRFPVLDIADAWDVCTALHLAIPGGIQHRYRREPHRRQTAIMWHPDGSWARASANGTELPMVHQSGPQRLWDRADDVRHDMLLRGMSAWLGARAIVRRDGSIRLIRGAWRATIPAG